MEDRRFSLRDLRSRFHVETMRKDFYGEYDTSLNTRRWYFRTADDCLNAQKFLKQFELHALHFPGAHEAHRSLLAMGGRKIVAHNAAERDDKRSLKRGVDFYVFPSAEARFEASALLRKQLMAPASSVAALDALLKSTPSDTFLKTSPQKLRDRLANVPLTRHEVQEYTARIEAAQKSRPRSVSAAMDDRRQTVESANLTCERLNLSPFGNVPVEAPETGEICGLLVGRGAHTLAVQVDERGDGVLLDRWKIATPLQRQYPVERAFDVGAVIHIRMHEGLGQAIQIRKERDFHYGTLLLKAQRVAEERGVLPILETEDLRDQDCEGEIVAHDDLTGAVLDEGGFLTVGALEDFGNLTAGRVRVGPTYFYAPKVYARSASR